MRVPVMFSLAVLLTGLSGLAWSNTMQCFNSTLDATEIDPPDRDEVAQRCGEPDGKEADGWVWRYDRDQFVYRLRFDNDGRLYQILREHRD